MPLPPDRNGYCCDSHDEEADDEMALEPVVTLAAIEYYFETGKADRDQSNAEIVNAELSTSASELALGGEFRRIVDQPIRQDQREQADGHIDEEYPAPRKAIGDPSAKRRANRGGSDYCHTVEGERGAEFGRW